MLPVNLSRLFNFSNNDRFKLNHFDCQDSKGKHRIRYYLPKLIQETDLQILNKTRCFAMLGFKSYTKKYILSNYNDSPCTIVDCYACNSASYRSSEII